jgi:hypothetical protein
LKFEIVVLESFVNFATKINEHINAKKFDLVAFATGMLEKATAKTLVSA